MCEITTYRSKSNFVRVFQEIRQAALQFLTADEMTTDCNTDHIGCL